MDLTVAVRFHSSPVTVGPGAGDCAEVGADGAVGDNEWLLQAAIPSAATRSTLPVIILITHTSVD
jgi:hypothetical protein